MSNQQTPAEKIERLDAMADNDGTWDFSDSDMETLELAADICGYAIRANEEAPLAATKTAFKAAAERDRDREQNAAMLEALHHIKAVRCLGMHSPPVGSPAWHAWNAIDAAIAAAEQEQE